MKDKFEEIFDTFGVVKLPVPESGSKYDWIRIELQSFLKLLNDPSHDFIQAVNDMFVECIAFPSFGCCSFPCAANMDEALKNAREALGLHLWSMEKDGDEIPEPTPITQIRCNANEVPAVIDVFMPPFRDKLNNRFVKKTLSLPAWLADLADKDGVNCSKIFYLSGWNDFLPERLEIRQQ